MNSTSTKSLIMTLVLLGAVPVLAGCTLPGGGGDGDDVIRIGTLLPLTGDLGDFGGDMQRAAQLAAKHINEAGGIDGKNVEIVTGDTASNPNEALNEFKRLVNTEGVVAVAGAAASSSTLAIMPDAAANNIPVVSPASTSPALANTTLTGGYFFRVPPSDALQGRVMAALLQENFTSAVVHAIYINNDYGVGFNEVLKANLAGLHAKSVAYDPDGTTFASEVQEVCAGSPTAIVLIGYVDTGASIMKEADNRACTEIPWYFSEGVKDEEFITKTCTDPANCFLAGFQGTAPGSGEGPNPALDNFTAAYKAEYGGDDPGLFAPETYEAVMWIALAIEQGGSTGGASIRDNISTVVNEDTGDTNVTSVQAALDAIGAGTAINWNGPAHGFDLSAENEPATGVYTYWVVDGNGDIVVYRENVEA